MEQSSKDIVAKLNESSDSPEEENVQINVKL